MKFNYRNLSILFLLMLIAIVYWVSASGWGYATIQDHKTMAEIEKNCPDYYRNRDGDCLRRTYRSIYFSRSSGDGSFGSGK